MRRECNKGCSEPKVNNDGIDCDGEFIGDNCVVMSENSYMQVTGGDRLSKFVITIANRFKAIVQALNKRIDYDTLYSNGNFYINDTDAASNGVQLGKPYIDVNGFVRVRIV